MSNDQMNWLSDVIIADAFRVALVRELDQISWKYLQNVASGEQECREPRFVMIAKFLVSGGRDIPSEEELGKEDSAVRRTWQFFLERLHDLCRSFEFNNNVFSANDPRRALPQGLLFFDRLMSLLKNTAKVKF